jgi:hypothetical protein
LLFMCSLEIRHVHLFIVVYNNLSFSTSIQNYKEQMDKIREKALLRNEQV